MKGHVSPGVKLKCIQSLYSSLKFKTMKNNSITIGLISLFAMIFAVGCQENTHIESLDLMTAEDDLIADAAYDDVFSEVDGVMNLMDQFGYETSALKSAVVLDTCPIISMISEPGSFWPRTVVVDYGDGCDVSHFNTDRERIRKGKILIKVSGPMWIEGSYREVTFEDFSINDFLVEGRRTVTNEGVWDEGEYTGLKYFSVVLEGGTITTPEGQVISKDVNRTRTFVEGEDTKWDTRDDIWHINGIATGVNRQGLTFTREITSPLWKEIGCRFITRGTVLIEAEGRPDVILDYGDGTCDPLVTITIEGETDQVRLRRW